MPPLTLKNARCFDLFGKPYCVFALNRFWAARPKAERNTWVTMVEDGPFLPQTKRALMAARPRRWYSSFVRIKIIQRQLLIISLNAFCRPWGGYLDPTVEKQKVRCVKSTSSLTLGRQDRCISWCTVLVPRTFSLPLSVIGVEMVSSELFVCDPIRLSPLFRPRSAFRFTAVFPERQVMFCIRLHVIAAKHSCCDFFFLPLSFHGISWRSISFRERSNFCHWKNYRGVNILTQWLNSTLFVDKINFAGL